MTGAEALRTILVSLRAAGIDDPARDARLLLAHAIGIAPDRLTLHLADEVEPTAYATLALLVAARSARQPISQILGSRLFWGRSFVVTSDVLDPRPDTEALIACALSEPFERVLDLGTGTGCILLTLLLERPGTAGLGVDLSADAIDVARSNITRFALQGAAELRQGDWFDPVTGTFDLIVSNPPYIAASEMAELAPEVRDWEPHLALSPGGDGLDSYRRILAKAGAYLVPGGRILVEIGATQGPAVLGLMQAGGFVEGQIHRDLDGRDRVVAGRLGA